MEAKVQTWLNNIASGNIRSKTERILDCIMKSGSNGIPTDVMRTRLGIAHQTLTGVLSVLNDAGMIMVVGTWQPQDSSNVYSIYRYVSDPKEQAMLKHYREREKVLQWLKKGIEDYSRFCTPPVSRLLEQNYDVIRKAPLQEAIQLQLFDKF